MAWENYLPTLVHVYNFTKNHAMNFNPYHLMYGWKHGLPIKIRFGQPAPQAEKHAHNQFLAKLSARLRWCHELADLHHKH